LKFRYRFGLYDRKCGHRPGRDQREEAKKRGVSLDGIIERRQERLSERKEKSEKGKREGGKEGGRRERGDTIPGKISAPGSTPSTPRRPRSYVTEKNLRIESGDHGTNETRTQK
jgi:hypothetical protein